LYALLPCLSFCCGCYWLQDYPDFLALFFAPLVSQLSTTLPQFEDSDLHKLRHAVLEVLAKLPPNDKLQPYLTQLMQVWYGAVLYSAGQYAFSTVQYSIVTAYAPCHALH
jgi:hypothetical protein